jgi:poly(A) polymerase
MDVTPKDYDVATSATPPQVAELFPGSETTGKSFAVTRAPVDGVFFEVATFRAEHSYSDGRRPDSISFTDPQTDAGRRDFTVNAMFYDPVKEELHDFTGGQGDIAAGIIRCVGEPDRRFEEDHLRMMRAVRFAGSLDFKIEPATADAIRKNAPKIAKISPERIQDELNRTLLESKRPGDSITLLEELGLLRTILPEISAMKGQEQPLEFHPEGDVFLHTVRMLNMMERRSRVLAYAVLFHDIGKPVTATVSDRIRFNKHDSAGAELAKSIMQRLRFPADDIESVSHCVANHMRFMNVSEMRKSTLRRLLGAPTFYVELELHRLDCASSHGDLSNYDFLVDFQEQLANEPVLPKPWVTGNDIIALGVPQSPRVGVLRTKAYDAQLEGRFKDRNELLGWLKTEIGNP